MVERILARALPDGLEPLFDLALDLHWTWSHASDVLWRRQADVWERTHNPWAVLSATSIGTLEAWARDPAFREQLARVVAERERYASEPCWCTEKFPDAATKPVAYFSMEYGLGAGLPLYAGGLGVLAGDYLKTASDLGLPIVAIGLLYQEGYFRQVVDARGRQQEAYPYNDPSDLPIQPVMGPEGTWLRVELILPGRSLFLRVWRARVGRVDLYLLDSNDPMNGPGDRGITAKLYGGGREMRLMQEMVLGIGGWMLVEALGLEIDVCHINEGHAAFAVLERARRFMRRSGVNFREALWATRAGNVFTTHTPVAAGFDLYPPALIRQYFPYFRAYLSELGLSLRELLGLGRLDPGNDDEPFNMAYLAMRGSARVNGVSVLHGKVSRALFRPLYPRWPEDEVPVEHVTNGIHVPTWDSAWSDRLWTEACGKGRWLGSLDRLARGIEAIDDEALWTFKGQERGDLVHYARQRLARQLGQRGAEADVIRSAEMALDPNALTLGFARRFAPYKRPNLLLADPDRLARLVSDADRPVQIIVAGKAHPDDVAGKGLVEAWLQFVQRADVRERVVFLEDYDMALAQQLVQGVDVWINTPRPPWEACGTSGMKVLANGGLNLSALDGWWAEAYEAELGWALTETANGEEDLAARDAREARELYRILEDDVVPMFFDRDAKGVPRAWVRRMRESIARLAPRFSSNRMLQEYVARLYQPAAQQVRRRCGEGGMLAQALSAWHEHLSHHWHQIHFGSVERGREADGWRFAVPVYLGDIAPDAVSVELYAAGDGDGPSVRARMERGEPIPGSKNGYLYRAQVTTERPDWHFTARVIPHHPEARVPAECGLITWQR